jgi:hypothetical protein
MKQEAGANFAPVHPEGFRQQYQVFLVGRLLRWAHTSIGIDSVQRRPIRGTA